MAVTGWLKGRRARIIGPCPAIATSLSAAGATFCSEGACDILVHCPELPQPQPAHEMDHTAWRHVLDQGLDQRFFAASAFAQMCREAKQGGAIIFIGSPEQSRDSAHAAAAGALGNLTKTLGVEWARDGIRVNAVLTSCQNATLGNLVAFLASDYAAYVTGAVMGIEPTDC